ncbi:hypothetical protein SAY87_018159 [Trapa incisa]|uniref:Uncharacterized protein n=1 Tax=Trapa incisa TaxID=236973 RepID=A0AAN7L1Z1_9MYRT|nr:hypothetical protein SAY87_018159 [Trapa incisa]
MIFRSNELILWTAIEKCTLQLSKIQGSCTIFVTMRSLLLKVTFLAFVSLSSVAVGYGGVTDRYLIPEKSAPILEMAVIRKALLGNSEIYSLIILHSEKPVMATLL